MKKIITLVLATVLVAGAFSQEQHHPNHNQRRPIHPFFFIKPQKVTEKKDVVVVTYNKKDWERLNDIKRGKLMKNRRQFSEQGKHRIPPFVK